MIIIQIPVFYPSLTGLLSDTAAITALGAINLCSHFACTDSDTAKDAQGTSKMQHFAISTNTGCVTHLSLLGSGDCSAESQPLMPVNCEHTALF